MTAELRHATATDPRIILIETNMSRGEILGLIRVSDAYISLHRSEGFGMGMAEAMNFGRIVIATDYSGCTDFLTNKPAFQYPSGCGQWPCMNIRGQAGNIGRSPTFLQLQLQCK